ncbi:hypothetical protein CONLIGDRAFT_562991, partial [Coniochaeta ligniaria NRRL 30616]
SHSQTQTTSHPHRANKSSTPLASPRQPFSVGQVCPPRLSPSATHGQDAGTPSPNYFGLSIDTATDPHESAALPRENWSPQTSSVRSFGAAIPQQLPLDANPEFEAFRRQADANRGRGFSLSTSQFGRSIPLAGTPSSSTPSASARPRPSRWHTQGSETSGAPFPRVSGLAAGARSVECAAPARMDIDHASVHDSTSVSANSRRSPPTSLTPSLTNPPSMNRPSMHPPSFLNMGRHESPARIDSPFAAPGGRPNISQISDQHPRLSMTHNRADPPSPAANHVHRADTVPTKLEAGGPSMMSPAQLEDLMEHTPSSELLILDLRVSPQYALSRIKGALNLCIPTTLLKRPTFNLQKLQTTFQGEQEQGKFANWQNTSYLVVYDAFSSDRRDALSAMNMIKKFVNEGYSGSMNILRGGFNAFAANYPELVDRNAGPAGGTGLTLGNTGSKDGRPTIAPVIGGVMLPGGSNNPNPFFSNIRQNQDLVDGVGQIKIGVPAGLTPESLPLWLREAADEADKGKKVSDKFLRIELTEQSRMKDAYSAFKLSDAGGNGAEETRVQLSGIEKGGKNRYKDILPFEHARVRLAGRPEGACDYVNASHLRSTRSHKRYIASQGPLPATFDDFWSVIWDQDVRVIVMLTAESEGGQLKCHPYWNGREFGPIKLRSLSEKKVSLDIDKSRSNSLATPGPAADSSSNASQAELGRRRANTTTSLESGAPTPSQPNLSSQSSNAGDTPYVIVRKFALSHAAHPFAPIREITQLHYPSWPDFGAPAQPSHLLALVELANVMQRPALPLDYPSTMAPDVSENASDTAPLSWYDSPESGDHVRPMLVHCSAGCGRTGAFCTVDSVIDMLKRQRLTHIIRANASQPLEKRKRGSVSAKGEKKDAEGDVDMDASISPLDASKDTSTFFRPTLTASKPSGSSGSIAKSASGEEIDLSWLDDDTVDLIASTVEDFRRQRLSMVQSLRQFVLCYETAIEWIWRLQQQGQTSGPGGRSRARSGSL